MGEFFNEMGSHVTIAQVAWIVAAIVSVGVFIGSFKPRLRALELKVALHDEKIAVLDKSLAAYKADNTQHHSVVEVKLGHIEESLHRIEAGMDKKADKQ